METNTQQINNKISYYFSYDSEYDEIYSSSYGATFIFIDEDEEAPDFDFDSIFPSGDIPGMS
ncbi:MAG: hypothetical protein WCS92_01705 [Candidatus Babeliales bacterium]